MIELPIHGWGMEPTEQSLNPFFGLDRSVMVKSPTFVVDAPYFN